MRDVTRKILVLFGVLLVLVLAGAVLVQPARCAGRSGEGDEKADKAEKKESAESGDEKPGDLWINLREKHGEDLDAAIDEAIREMEERLETLQKEMDELKRRSPRLREFDRNLPHMLRERRLRDRDETQPRPEVDELLRGLERELPREWPLHMQELLRELERGQPRGGQVFQFELGPKPDRFAFTLRMDMQETDEAYTFTLDMPGMEKEDIVVEVDEDVLSISGERKERVEEEREGERVQREITYGQFKRTITLPRDAVLDKITSKYEDGVLTITVPRTQQEAEKSRRIIVHHP